MSKKYFLLICLLMGLLAMPMQASAKAKLNKTSITLLKGATRQLKMKGTTKSVKWSSSKSSVARVDATGLVTARKKGKAVITAKVGSKKYTCKVTVKQPVTSIKLKKTSICLKVKKTYTMKTTVAPKTADNRSLLWSSSNAKVAKVNSKGKITAVGIGEAVITATAKDGSGVAAQCSVCVTATGEWPMKLDQGSMTLTTRDSARLTATNAKGTVTWTSSNSDVVTVAEDGTVYAAKVGSATITAASAGETATCVVNSQAPQASASAYRFLGIVNRYSLELQDYKANGCLVGYSNSGKLNAGTWEKAKAELNAKQTTYTNCALLVRWALIEMGYLSEGQMLYGINSSSHSSSHTWCYKGIHFGSQAVRDRILEHCEIIEVHDTPDHLAVTGQLLPGDILTWDGMTHTNVFIGNGTFFDAGRGPSDGSYWSKSSILSFGIPEATVTSDIKNDSNNPDLSSKTYIFNSFGPEEQWDRYYCGSVGYIIRIVK
jgi:uncharacterized protein YjdB